MAIEARAGLAPPIRSPETPLSRGDPSASSAPPTIISQSLELDMRELDDLAPVRDAS
jgi:hypothetical protein